MGYIINGENAVTVKIDAGEALPFIDDLKSAEGIKHHPRTRDMIVGTAGYRISFQ